MLFVLNFNIGTGVNYCKSFFSDLMNVINIMVLAYPC